MIENFFIIKFLIRAIVCMLTTTCRKTKIIVLFPSKNDYVIVMKGSHLETSLSLVKNTVCTDVHVILNSKHYILKVVLCSYRCLFKAYGCIKLIKTLNTPTLKKHALNKNPNLDLEKCWTKMSEKQILSEKR